jgi:hypothetical protein
VRDAGGIRVPTRRHVEFLIAFLAVVATVNWRRGDYFAGSLDPVVAAKGILTATALVLAWGLAQSGPRRRLGTGACWWTAAILVSSLLGALGSGHLWASGVIVVRVAMVACTVFLLLRAAPGLQVVTDVATACGVVAVVAAVTGIPGMTDGRLAGGFPAMAANGLSLLAAAVVLVLMWRTALGLARWPAALAAALFLGIIWETGSRTVLLMLAAAALVMVLQTRRPRVGLVVGALLGSGAVVVLAALTGAITGFLERDGTGLSTVDSRMIAWHAALSQDGGIWQSLFGSGLSVKIIHVTGQYWDTQPLDSTWMSLLVQSGFVGAAIAALWALWSLVRAARTPYAHRVVFLGLLVFLIGRSVLESGLIDATPDFMLFMATALLSEGGSRTRVASEATASEPRAREDRPALSR